MTRKSTPYYSFAESAEVAGSSAVSIVAYLCATHNSYLFGKRKDTAHIPAYLEWQWEVLQQELLEKVGHI